MTVLCDTGPLFAAINTTDVDHRICLSLFDMLRARREQLLIPQTVIAEVGFLLTTRVGAESEARFLSDIAERVFEVANLTPFDFARMSRLVRQYSDFPLGTTDASVVALAERLGVTRIATLDHRHFRAITPAHIPAFELLPT